jgi:uncharacterized membrane protein YfcA
VLLAAVAVLAGAVAQSATGFGFALIASPALFAVFDSGEAVTAIAVLSIVLSVLVMADGGSGLVRWRALRPVHVAALPGLALGLVALEVLPKAVLQLVVGVAVVIAVLVQLRQRAAGAEPGETSLAAAGAVGATTGVLTTSIGVSGPPMVMWLEARGAAPGEFRVTMAAGFLVLNFVAVPALIVVRGAGDAIELGHLLPLLGVLVAGYGVGAVAFRRLSAEAFRVAVLVLVVAAGVASAVAGITSL